MEQIDVLDSSGEPVGFSKLRPEIHRDGDWHRSVHVWIMTPRMDVLVQKRATQKDLYPSMWALSTSGHISAGDTSLITAVREVWEELGVVVDEKEAQYLFTIKSQRILDHGKFIDNELNDIYLIVREIKISDISIQEQELSEVRLIPFLQLKKIIEAKDPEFIQEKGYDRVFKEIERIFMQRNFLGKIT